MEENIAYFRKSFVPATIINKYTKNDCFIQLRGKGDVDYYGVYLGKYISFEVKETSKDVFLLSRISPHQLEILLMVKRFSGESFLLLNFASHNDSCYLIPTETLEKWIFCGHKRISLDNAREIGHNIPISFPGIIDFLSFFRVEK